MDQNIKDINYKIEILQEQKRMIEEKEVNLTKEQEKEILKYIKYTLLALEVTKENYGKDNKK